MFLFDGSLILMTEFPDGCDSFRGPHTEKCLRSIWQSGKCLDDGRSSPDLVPIREKLIQTETDIMLVVACFCASSLAFTFALIFVMLF